MHNVCLCTSAAIGHHLTASVAFANAQQQLSVSAAADDRFPQPAGAELTIELATWERSASAGADDRNATRAIVPARTRFHVRTRLSPQPPSDLRMRGKRGTRRPLSPECERRSDGPRRACSGRARGVRPTRRRLPLRLGGAEGSCSRSPEWDAWKARTSASRSKWRVEVEYGESVVFGCCGGDQRVGGRDAVVAIGTLGQLTECDRRCVGDGAVVAQDA
jgi:hypothetical protein